jgi:hypothetical protein
VKEGHVDMPARVKVIANNPIFLTTRFSLSMKHRSPVSYGLHGVRHARNSAMQYGELLGDKNEYNSVESIRGGILEDE